MKAKDTVISEQELDKLAKANPLLDFSFEDDYREEVRLMRESQAEITWDKAIREVVEWIELHEKSTCMDCLCAFDFRNDEWQAKLKDWGIDEADKNKVHKC